MRQNVPIDWDAIIAKQREAEQMELEPINYWTDSDTITEALEIRGLGESSRASQKKEIIAFGRWLEERDTTEPTKAMCDEYLASRRDRVSAGAARSLRGVLLKYGDYIEGRGFIKRNAFRDTSEKELRITRKDSEEATKRAKGLYSLGDVASLLLAIERGDAEAIADLIR